MSVALIAQPGSYHVKDLVLVPCFLVTGPAENSKRVIADHACIRLGVSNFCAGGDLYKKEKGRERKHHAIHCFTTILMPLLPLSSFSLFFSLRVAS